VQAIIRVSGILVAPFGDLVETFNRSDFWNVEQLTPTGKRRPATSLVDVPMTVLSILLQASEFFLIWFYHSIFFQLHLFNLFGLNLFKLRFLSSALIILFRITMISAALITVNM
jgi:hypothetical protein